MYQFLYENEELLDRFIAQLDYRPLTECFIKILSLEYSSSSEETYFVSEIFCNGNFLVNNFFWFFVKNFFKF